MTNIASPRKLMIEELNQKVDKLSGEFGINKVLNRFTPLERQKISVILNEIKYNVHRIKNMV
jgi:hypothetical protein